MSTHEVRDLVVGLAAIAMVVGAFVIFIRDPSLEGFWRMSTLNGVAILMLWTIGK